MASWPAAKPGATAADADATDIHHRGPSESFTLVGVSLGRHKLKGVRDPVHIVQCSDFGLEMRPIPARFTVRAGETVPAAEMTKEE